MQIPFLSFLQSQWAVLSGATENIVDGGQTFPSSFVFDLFEKVY